MNRLTKCVIAALTLAAMSGTALAQDPPPDDTTGGEAGAEVEAGAGAEVTGDPAATTDPAATDPAMAPVAPGKVIGADAVFLLPLGDYADVADAAFGAMGRFEFGINPALSITARAGLLYNLAKADGITILFIPVYAGVKYNIGTSGLFGQGEVGINHARISLDGGGSDSETKLSFQAGAGYQMGKLQFRAGFWYVASDPASMGIMASAGFNFASL